MSGAGPAPERGQQQPLQQQQQQQRQFIPGAPSPPRAGDEIVIAGQFFHTGTKVVTWLDPGGFDGYSCLPPLPASTAPGAPASASLAEHVGSAMPLLIPVPRHGKRSLKHVPGRSAEDKATTAAGGLLTNLYVGLSFLTASPEHLP